MVRHRGIDRIIWTFDPLLSSNAHLNIAKLGAVCNTYLPHYYGVMRDGLNVGLSSDRLKVDWWVNSPRVLRRLGRRKRRQLDMAHYISAGAAIVNPTRIDADGWVHPQPVDSLPDTDEKSVLLLEIPYNFMTLKRESSALAKTWREHTYPIFKHLFEVGYLVTDFVYLTGRSPRSFYVLSHGERTL
jgi:predicted GNAT superfamily acetyltransferase